MSAGTWQEGRLHFEIGKEGNTHKKSHLPFYFGIDGAVDEGHGKEAQDGHDDGADDVAVDEPQLDDGRETCPVRAEERDRT